MLCQIKGLIIVLVMPKLWQSREEYLNKNLIPEIVKMDVKENDLCNLCNSEVDSNEI